MAVNCSVVPFPMVAFCGLMLMDCNTAGPRVNVPEPDTSPTVAVMIELPTASAEPRPELLMVATLPDEEVHVARVLTSWVEVSVSVAVAVNCWFVPAGIVTAPGVTPIELITAVVTVIGVEPVMDPEVTETFAEPMAFPVTRPLPFTAT